MKYYSDYSRKFIEDVCKELNDSGFYLSQHDKIPFNTEYLLTMTELIQDLVSTESLYKHLISKNMINNGICPYTGAKIDNSHAWTFMGTRRIYLSKVGLEIMKHEADYTLSTMSGVPRNSSVNNKTKSGCYIATMCYEDEFCREVISLKTFRDTVLSHYFLGQIFIQIYYKISPFIVEKLSKRNKITKLIRTLILDKIVKLLPKY